jgi:dihydrofolate reductase
MTKITIISAMSENRVIGKNGDLPWRVKRDYDFFVRNSLGKPAIMGRGSFESVAYTRENRSDIVITSDPEWSADGILVARSFDDALHIARGLLTEMKASDIIIGGGTRVYTQALEVATDMLLTTIHCTVDGGDAFFPVFDENEWDKVSQEFFPAIDGETADHTITHWQRKPRRII